MKYHKTKDGRKIKLCDLELNHLKNIIRYIERRADEGHTIIIGSGVGDPADMWMDELTLYGEEALNRLNYYHYKEELEKRQKATMEEINNALYTLLGAVGSSVEFTYKGNRKVKGVLLEPIENGITLKLEKDYKGRNEYWEKGEKKHFDNRVVYNYNCA